MTNIKFNEEGKCPLCGRENADCYDSLLQDDTYTYRFACKYCGCYWDALYSLNFVCVDNVYDKNNNLCNDQAIQPVRRNK